MDKPREDGLGTDLVLDLELDADLYNEISLGGREGKHHKPLATHKITDETSDENPLGRKRVGDERDFESIAKAISHLSAEFKGLRDEVKDLKLKQNEERRRTRRSNETFSKAEVESMQASRSRSRSPRPRGSREARSLPYMGCGPASRKPGPDVSRSESESRAQSQSPRRMDDEDEILSIHAGEDLTFLVPEEPGSDDADTEDIMLIIEKEIDEDKERGPPVSDKLAKIMNKRFQNRLDEPTMKNKIERYKTPGNCEETVPPIINRELLQPHIGLKRTAKRDDARLMTAQKMITRASTAIAVGVDKLHHFASSADKNSDVDFKKMTNKVIENCLDACAFLGNAQQDLTLRRRFQMYKDLPLDIRSICYHKGESGQSGQLFGDDLPRQMKEARDAHRLSQARNRGSFHPGRRPFLGGRGRGYPPTSVTQTRPQYKRRGQSWRK